MNSLLQTATTLATLGATGLAAYHHVGYPVLLRAMRRTEAAPAALADSVLPAITVIMPAYNEANYIAAKLRNIAALDYPAHRLRVQVICDGCTDETASIARATLREANCEHLDASIVDCTENRGKVAVLNDAVAAVRDEIVVLTDVSAMLPADALRRAAVHFADPALGAVGGTYRLAQAGCAGESTYWAVQLGVKLGEAALGAPLGLHGAFYAFRRVAWAPLSPDTINDDFILPMRMFAEGWRIAYDPTIVALEAEQPDAAASLRRRRRIAAGNAQQLVQLRDQLHPQ